MSSRPHGRRFFFKPPTIGQVLRLGEWEGEIESGVDFARQDTKTGAQPFSLESTRTEEKFRLRHLGASLWDPRLLRFSLGGTFGLSQEWQQTEASSASRHGTLWGYDFFASILPEGAYSLNLFANRDQSFLSRELAGRTEVRSENRGATLFARRLYIPSLLSFRQELHEAESRTAGITGRREEHRNILTYDGQRGWVDSETRLRYEFIDSSDQVIRNLGYQSHEGSFYYSQDFGPELNRRWDSWLRFFTRTGVVDVTTLNVDELLRIDHTEQLWTDYRYFFTRTDTQGGATNTHIAAFNLNHRLYESLTTTFGLDNTFQTLPGGWKVTARSRMNFLYTKRLPADGRLNVGLGGGFQYDDNRFREGLVVQETHTATTPFALPIQLRNPFVIVESIVVTKTALGADTLVDCPLHPSVPRVLVLGVDYTVRTVGDITEIVPRACSGVIPGINRGDTIAVDYRFRAPPLSFTTGNWQANLSVDYRWIRPYFIHEQSNQSLLSGRDGRFLDDVRSDTLGTELRYDGQRVRASLVGEGRWFSSDRVSYNSLRSNQFVSFSILPELTLSLSGDQAFFDFSKPDRQTLTIMARATLTYIPGPDLFVDTFVGSRWLEDTLLPTERVTDVGLRARWFFRRIEVNPTFEFIDRQRGNTDTKDYRVTLKIIRRFSYP